jgi:hypothetical protein
MSLSATRWYTHMYMAVKPLTSNSTRDDSANENDLQLY